ncbi:MAG: hypothetical protein QNK35_17585 [Bacteroides sp.]|nr:hypothetical protein [Bacteroides sp.]
MKKLVIISLALVMSISAYSQTSGFGIGANLGSSLDFSLKYWTSENTAIAAAAGFSFWNYGGFHASGDFLWHLWGWSAGKDQMKVYLGPGVGMGIYSGYSQNFAMSVRAASGVGYYFNNIALELHADIVPMVGLFGPWSGADFDVAYFVGARWYF